MKHACIETKHDILRILHENRHRLRALGVRNIGLFGSYVRGEQNSESDIDLLVEFESGRKSFDAFMELASWLEAVLKHKIEILTVESLSPYIGPYILKEVEYASIAA